MNKNNIFAYIFKIKINNNIYIYIFLLKRHASYFSFIKLKRKKKRLLHALLEVFGDENPHLRCLTTKILTWTPYSMKVTRYVRNMDFRVALSDT